MRGRSANPCAFYRMRSMLKADVSRLLEGIEARSHEFQSLLASATEVLSRTLVKYREDAHAASTNAEPRHDTSESHFTQPRSPACETACPVQESSERLTVLAGPAQTREMFTPLQAGSEFDTFPVSPVHDTMVTTPSRHALSSTNLDDLMRASSARLMGDAGNCAWINKHYVWPSTVFSETAPDDIVCTWFPRTNKGRVGHKTCHLLPYFTDGRWRLARFDTSQHTLTCYDSMWNCGVENRMYDVCMSKPSNTLLC